MDTQKPKPITCSTCGRVLEIDQHGIQFCANCSNTPHQKELYEEAFFDLKDYKK